MKDLISIIVPVYNASNYLEVCIESILKQKYKNIELLLIDDGSTDNSKEICLEYSNNDKRVNYYYKKNGGVSSARNYGIKKSKGEFIFFIDADDWLEENSLEELINNKKGLPSLKHKAIFNNKTKIIDDIDIINKNKYIEDIINGKYNAFIWGYLFDAKLVKKILFDENTYYLEDMIFLFNYLECSNIKNVYFTNSYYNYRINEDSITNNSNRILDKCKKILYSIDTVNNNTNGKYLSILNDKKVRIIEEQIRFINDKKEMKKVVNEIKIPIYNSKSFLYKYYSKLFNKKRITELCIYYKIRNIIKNFKKVG